MSNCAIARIGLVLIAAAIAAGPGGAAAKHLKHVPHRHTWTDRVRNARASASETSYLGAMRYFGGPKSPMWRSVQ